MLIYVDNLTLILGCLFVTPRSVELTRCFLIAPLDSALSLPQVCLEKAQREGEAIARPQCRPACLGPAHLLAALPGGVPGGRGGLPAPCSAPIACVCPEQPGPRERRLCPPVRPSWRDDLSPALGTKRQPAM